MFKCHWDFSALFCTVAYRKQGHKHIRRDRFYDAIKSCPDSVFEHSKIVGTAKPTKFNIMISKPHYENVCYKCVMLPLFCYLLHIYGK